MGGEVELPSGVEVWERGWLSSNNVLLRGPDDCALIDSGYWTHSEQTVALARATLLERRLDRLLNTHLHSDHCGGNAALQAEYPLLQTSIPPGDAGAVVRWDEDALSYRSTGQHCPRFRFQHVLEPGTTLKLGGRAWEIHAAPGHDPHSVILFEPADAVLISADALWKSGFGVVFPELIGEPSFQEVATTLDLIESLNPRIVIPGHGAVFTETGPALATARRRLAGLARDPLKHAAHAAKVLVKFKLLELKRIDRASWNRWIESTAYFELIRSRFFAETTLLDLTTQLLDELCMVGAVALVGDCIENR